jgi:hypothetical protein
MTAARTEAQREASRANGRKSRGPITADGKRQSRRNGLRDGAFAEAVLPDDFDARLAAMVAAFERRHRPRDDYERELVRTAALAQVKLDHLQRAELLEDAHRVRHAVRAWDEARDKEVDRLTDLLDADPAGAVEGLARTAEGCDRMGDLWQSLADRLAESGRWTAAESRLALGLMGLSRPPRPDLDPDLARVWRHARALRVLADPEAEAARRGKSVEAVTAGLPGRDEALALVSGFVAEQVAKLAALGDELWERFDRPDRAAAPGLALFDRSDDGRRLRRALAESERLRRRALAELARLRAEAPAVPAPAPSTEPEPSTEPPRPEPAPFRSPARSEPEPIPAPRPPIPAPAPRIDLGVALDAPDSAFVPIRIAPPPRP